MTLVRPRFFSLHKLLSISALCFYLFLFYYISSAEVKSPGEIGQEGCTYSRTVNRAGYFSLPDNWLLYTCPGGKTYECKGTECSTDRSEVAKKKTVSEERILKEYDASCKKNYGESSYVDSTGKCFDPTQSVCTTNFNLIGCLSWIADIIIGNIVSLINIILSWILSIAMYLLDLVIYITVVKFTQNFAELKLDLNPSGSLGGIGSGTGAAIFGSNGSGLIYYIWGMLRDFVNLLLLITIIYYAVRTMFQGFGEHRDKFLYLLIFSIVINFSLFFVKFAIDLSNILSLQAYTLMANPASFEDWKGFRQNAGGGKSISGVPLVGDVTVKPNATLGDYLLNIASIGGVHKKSISADAAEQRINEGMKASWVYQVIVMLMYIGLIYIVFFLAGLLVLRAAAFLFAMLLAALLAADVFFSIFSIDNKDFMDGIKGATDKIKDDFYEALIKGPVLFLFLFLVGVLSNAIFNQSLQAEITNIASGSKEFQVFGKAFEGSLTIFLKFAMFFALTKVLFDKLGVMKFGDNSKLAKGSKAFSNFLMKNTVGRGAGALGWAGRNTIGRAFGSYADRRIQTFKDRDESLKKRAANANNGVSRFAWQRLGDLNKYRQGRAENFKKGALASGGYNTNAGLAAAAKRATGAEVDFGKGFDNAADKEGRTGYEKGDAARKARKEGRENDITENRDFTREEQKKVDDTVVDFAGQKYTKKELDEIISAHGNTASGSDIVTSTGKTIKADVRDKYFAKDPKTKRSQADYATYNLEDLHHAAEKKVIADRKSAKDFEKKLKLAEEDSEEGAEARKFVSASAAKKSDDERKKGNRKAIVLSAADQIQETIEGLSGLGSNPDAEAEIERLKDYKIKLEANQDNLKFFEGNDLFAEEIIQSKLKAAKIIRSATSTSRTGLVDSETAIKRELELAKRGVDRSEFDSWNSELAAMASARPSEARKPEFRARKRKLEADIASANRNGVRRSGADIDAIEDRLKDASIEVRKNEEARGRAVQIERNAEGVRSSFSRAFQVKVEAAPAKPEEKKH